MKSVFKFAVFTIVAMATVTLTACSYYPPGPPYHRHEPVHYYEYYYYPSVGVYFHIYSGYYYYRRGRVWVRVRTLPRDIRLYPQERVIVRSKDPRPYLKHEQHRKLYPPKRYEKNGRFDRREREQNTRRYQDYQKRYGTREEYQRQRRHDELHYDRGPQGRQHERREQKPRGDVLQPYDKREKDKDKKKRRDDVLMPSQ